MSSAASSSGSRRNGLEWAVFALGVLLVGTVLVYLAVQSLGGSEGSAALQVRLGSAEARAGQALVPVVVTNEGDRVAEDARIEVCAAGGAPCAEVTFPYVPSQAERRGHVGFARMPTGPLTARVVSYREP